MKDCVNCVWTTLTKPYSAALEYDYTRPSGNKDVKRVVEMGLHCIAFYHDYLPAIF